MCMFNHSLEWYNTGAKQTYTLTLWVGRVAYTGVRLVTLECTREVVNPLYHCRHSATGAIVKLEK